MLNAKSKNSVFITQLVAVNLREPYRQLSGSDLRDQGTRINTELIKVDMRGPITRINCTSRGGSERPNYSINCTSRGGSERPYYTDKLLVAVHLRGPITG
jgi:hypothetical protein